MSESAAISIFTLTKLVVVLAFDCLVIVSIHYSLSLAMASLGIVVLEVLALLVSFLGHGL
jgi:hypothetical protein